MKDAELVLHFARPSIEIVTPTSLATRNSIRWSSPQERGVGRETEVNRFPQLGGAPAAVRDRRLEHGEIEQRLARKR